MGLELNAATVSCVTVGNPASQTLSFLASIKQGERQATAPELQPWEGSRSCVCKMLSTVLGKQQPLAGYC